MIFPSWLLGEVWGGEDMHATWPGHFQVGETGTWENTAWVGTAIRSMRFRIRLRALKATLSL
jgi:hypothetical protein